jgi:hypothetical protein
MTTENTLSISDFQFEKEWNQLTVEEKETFASYVNARGFDEAKDWWAELKEMYS